MSSIFRNVIKSRRKRRKARSTTPVNISEFSSKLPDIDTGSSCNHNDHCTTRKIGPQQHLLSGTNGEYDSNSRGQSPFECHPNRSRSFDSPSDLHFGSNLNAPRNTPKDSHVKRKFFKSLRRKSKHDTVHNTNTGSVTPDTVVSAGFTPTKSSSDHDRRLSLPECHPNRSRSRSMEFRSEEIQGDVHLASSSNNSHVTPLNSRDRQQVSEPFRRKSKSFESDAEHKTNTSSKTSDTVDSCADSPNNSADRTTQQKASCSSGVKASPWGESDSTPARPKSLKLRFRQTETNDCPQTTTPTKERTQLRMQKRSIHRLPAHHKSGNTKTVIMNGDIVVCNSYNSKSSGDTVTISSSASSKSKAKALRRESERNARAASALDDKGNDLFEKGYFDKAMACYTKALKLKRRTFAHLLEETEEELILRDDGGKLTDPQALVSMATSINNIGYLRQRSGDATPEETMAAYKKSLRIKRRILGNDSLSVGKTLNNIGSVHYLKRDFDRALSAYDEALEIMKANLGDKHPDVATVMSNIGDVYLAQENKETSVKYYRLALVIRWEAFGEKSPRVVRLLEKISNLEIGDMSCKMTSQKTHAAWGDDVASEVMVGSGFEPISDELKLLQEQVRNDIEQVDQMERNAAVELLKDKIIIIRGMRDVWNGNGSGPELLDNDSASVMTAMSRLSSRGCLNE